MKILLIYPPITMPKGDISPPTKTILIGLGYIASMLFKHGYNLTIVDGMGELNRATYNDNWTRYGLTDSEIKHRIIEFNPDIVGISCMYTSYYRDALHVARIVKENNPGILTVLGGAHASAFPNEIMKDNNVDCVVVGEGEYTLLEIADRYSKKQALDGIKGIYYRKDNKVIKEEPREFIKDLDGLPFPAWHLLEYKKVNELNRDNRFVMRKPVGNILTSRGCPLDCSFCTSTASWGVRWRGRSARNIVDELEILNKELGFREIQFVDDNCSVSKERLISLCKEIINRKIDIRWTPISGLGYWSLSPDVLYLMKKSGCYRLTFGIESGSADTLRVIGKGKMHDWDKLRRTIGYANKIGFWTAGTFIIGFPHETEKDFRETLKKAEYLNLDFAVFYLLFPLPGTRIYKTFKDKKLLNFDPYLDPTYKGDDFSILARINTNGYPTENFNLAELQDWLSRIYRSYFLYKAVSFKTYLNLLRKLKTLEDVRYTYGLAGTGIRSFLKSLYSRYNIQMLRRSDINLIV